jgi:hypothetical protein
MSHDGMPASVARLRTAGDNAKRVKECFARLFRKSPRRDGAGRLRHLFAAAHEAIA